MRKKDEEYAIAVPVETPGAVYVPEAQVPTAITLDMLGEPKRSRRGSLPTFQAKMPRVSREGLSCCWLPILGVSNCLIFGFIWVVVLEGALGLYLVVPSGFEDLTSDGDALFELISYLVVPFAIALAAYCRIFYKLSVKLPDAKPYSEEEFAAEISHLQNAAPELEAFVDCYHVERQRSGSDLVDVDVSTFTTSETQEFRDFVDVSPSTQFKTTGRKRYVVVDMESVYEPIDETTRKDIYNFKFKLRMQHRHRDTLIRVSDVYKIPNMPERIVIDRSPSSSTSCVMSNCTNKCAVYTLCGFPWMLYRNMRMEFLKYQNKKLISSSPIDEGYKRYIEEERPKYDIIV